MPTIDDIAANRLAASYAPGTLVRSARPGEIHRAQVSSVKVIDGVPHAVVCGRSYRCVDLEAIRPPVGEHTGSDARPAR